MSKPLSIIVMAAGKGTRMNNPDMAKVMFEVNGKPMVQHVVELAAALSPFKLVVVVGWQKDSVINHLSTLGLQVVFVEQSPQLGTGHAVMQAAHALAGFDGDVLVLSGDVPLLTFTTLSSLVNYHRLQQATATVLTAVVEDPTGYGRILRNREGNVEGIIEQKDATEEQRRVTEVNSGIYVFDAMHLFEGLKHITPLNAQKEYYLTDVFSYFRSHRFRVAALPASDSNEILGINTVQQLEEARQTMASRKVDNRL